MKGRPDDLDRLGQDAARALGDDAPPAYYDRAFARLEQSHRKRRRVRKVALVLAFPALAFAAVPAYQLARRAQTHIAKTATERQPVGAPAEPYGTATRTTTLDESASTIACRDVDGSEPLPPFTAVQTFPSSRLREAVGMCVRPSGNDFERLLDQLAHAGVRRVSFDIGWDAVPYDAATAVADDHLVRHQAHARAIVGRGMRPVVKLLGNPGGPTPSKRVKVEVARAAAIGATEIRLAPSSVRALAAGRSGLTAASRGIVDLFTSIASDGRVTLARPLTRDLPAGRTEVTVYAFAPFESPRLADDRPNPVFEASLRGWLGYVESVCRSLAEVAPDGYDLELVDQRSDFFDRSRYDQGSVAGAAGDEIRRAIVARTAEWLRRPEAGCGSFRLLDNFSHRDGTVAPANAPGVDLVARHVVVHAHEVLQLSGDARRKVPQVSRERAVFPEVPLLDVADSIGLGTPAGGAKSATAPIAVTSFNLNPRKMTPRFEAMPPAEVWRFRSKAVLRALSSYTGQGATVLDIYRAYEPDVTVVDRSAADGGAVLRSLRRFLDHFQGEVPAGGERTIRVGAISACDATAALPAERLAIAPFQNGADTFAIAIYVMSRDLLHPYQETDAGDGRRHDRPQQLYGVWIEGVRGADARVALYDPLDDRQGEVTVLAREAGRLRVALPLTDSPRVLVLKDGP